jgi:branched-chain amino acid transport system substrate-binding protein
MWKQIISEAIFVVGTVTMLACFAPGAEPLKIGMVATFSGPGADSGRYQIQGTELAIDEVN